MIPGIVIEVLHVTLNEAMQQSARWCQGRSEVLQSFSGHDRFARVAGVLDTRSSRMSAGEHLNISRGSSCSFAITW